MMPAVLVEKLVVVHPGEEGQKDMAKEGSEPTVAQHDAVPCFMHDGAGVKACQRKHEECKRVARQTRIGQQKDKAERISGQHQPYVA